MSQFESLEGPRRNESELHLVQNENTRVVALASRVEARSMSRKTDFRKMGSVEVEDGEAHIGDKIWFVLSTSNDLEFAFHSENKARDKATRNHRVAGVEVKHWNTISGGLYRAEELED